MVLPPRTLQRNSNWTGYIFRLQFRQIENPTTKVNLNAMEQWPSRTSLFSYLLNYALNEKVMYGRVVFIANCTDLSYIISLLTSTFWPKRDHIKKNACWPLYQCVEVVLCSAVALKNSNAICNVTVCDEIALSVANSQK